MRLPRGTNRNRILRRPVDGEDEEVDLAEVEDLFRRFWREFRRSTAGSWTEGGPSCV
jgi:hypothetical protein